VIVLDTHAWLWLASQPKLLSPRARAALERAERLGICPISCWELAAKVARGKLRLDREVRLWVRQALALPRVELVPLDEDIAVLAGQLGQELPGDPADRLIAATAIQLRAELVTKDRVLRACKTLRTIW
jgi:PIN domain nuclease of toxin-antitoxin system